MATYCPFDPPYQHPTRFNEKKKIYFQSVVLPLLNYSKCVFNIITQDLKESASIKPAHQKLNVVLDEVNVFATERVINLIDKSWPFNCQCFLSFQTISDLNIKNTILTDTVFGNVTSIICHNLKDPNTAECVSSVFCTRKSKKLTRQIDFNGSSSQMGSVHSVEEFIMHPNKLKPLKIGECCVKTHWENVHKNHSTTIKS